jgi:hypothetical protein
MVCAADIRYTQGMKHFDRNFAAFLIMALMLQSFPSEALALPMQGISPTFHQTRSNSILETEALAEDLSFSHFHLLKIFPKRFHQSLQWCISGVFAMGVAFASAPSYRENHAGQFITRYIMPPA